MPEIPPIIAITMGDPAGIGPEVLLKFAASEIKNPTPLCRIVAVADGKTLKATAKQFDISLPFHFLEKFHTNQLAPNALNVLDLHNLPEGCLATGRVREATGKASVEYVLKAVELAMKGEVDAITTAPICKEAIHLAGFPYPGHTELLAETTKTEDFAMMMVGGKVRVVLVTTHLPLKDVAKEITKERVARTIRLTDRSLHLYEGKRPSIAVAALNPHAGDGGVLGREELETIIPAVEECAKEGIRVTGPYPADSLFAKAKRGDYDAVVVMYHDQGLIPVKMEGFGGGVNVTLGLPIIRTSVDHGVAFDIAGKGLADPSSMGVAVRYAAVMVRCRRGF